MMLPVTPDLRQLRYFVTVAEEKHFGRAAARLSMTQPPLSQAIRALEETLGVALFARTKRSVELTPVGADLLPEVRRLLASAEALRPLAQSLARGEAGVLSLAFVSTADYGLLPLAAARFRRAPSARAPAIDRGDQRRADRRTGGRPHRRGPRDRAAAAASRRAVVVAADRARAAGDRDVVGDGRASDRGAVAHRPARSGSMRRSACAMSPTRRS